MKYVVLFEDNDKFADMRQKHMADHLKFLAENSDLIDAAGPLKDATSAAAAGGIWVVECNETSQVQELVESDPFYPTGLRQTIRILEWTQVFADGRKLI